MHLRLPLLSCQSFLTRNSRRWLVAQATFTPPLEMSKLLLKSFGFRAQCAISVRPKTADYNTGTSCLRTTIEAVAMIAGSTVPRCQQN